MSSQQSGLEYTNAGALDVGPLDVSFMFRYDEFRLSLGGPRDRDRNKNNATKRRTKDALKAELARGSVLCLSRLTFDVFLCSF